MGQWLLSWTTGLASPRRPALSAAAVWVLMLLLAAWYVSFTQELNKARCGILIGSAFGGMTSFATAVEALETQSEQGGSSSNRSSSSSMHCLHSDNSLYTCTS
jgi:uncharacterized transporter YbjL